MMSQMILVQRGKDEKRGDMFKMVILKIRLI